jgi:hypothetical protein
MSNVRAARARAYFAQSGRCVYCNAPTWLTDPEKFARGHGLVRNRVRLFQATAEHLVAQQDGGCGGDNIAMACWLCNHRRHARKGQAPAPEMFRHEVEKRLANASWWPPGVSFVQTRSRI